MKNTAKYRMPGRFLEIPVFLGDYFIMPHPVDWSTGFVFVFFVISFCYGTFYFNANKLRY